MYIHSDSTLICNFHPFQVLINIEDINDNLPLFDVADYNISIVEHIPNGFEIMQFHATDKVKLFNIVFGQKPDCLQLRRQKLQRCSLNFLSGT